MFPCVVYKEVKGSCSDIAYSHGILEFSTTMCCHTLPSWTVFPQVVPEPLFPLLYIWVNTTKGPFLACKKHPSCLIGIQVFPQTSFLEQHPFTTGIKHSGSHIFWPLFLITWGFYFALSAVGLEDVSAALLSPKTNVTLLTIFYKGTKSKCFP